MSDFFEQYKIHPRDCLLEVRLQKGSEEHELCDKLFCPCPTTALLMNTANAQLTEPGLTLPMTPLLDLRFNETSKLPVLQ